MGQVERKQSCRDMKRPLKAERNLLDHIRDTFTNDRASSVEGTLGGEWIQARGKQWKKKKKLLEWLL